MQHDTEIAALRAALERIASIPDERATVGGPWSRIQRMQAVARQALAGEEVSPSSDPAHSSMTVKVGGRSGAKCST